jgi:ABC-type Zn uptake system ZnuABC Zn-binding protein ZnuA
MKAVKEKLAETKPDSVQDFEKGAAAYAKKIIANFKDYEFVSVLKTNAIHC